jgi:hypothetical protein
MTAGLALAVIEPETLRAASLRAPPSGARTPLRGRPARASHLAQGEVILVDFLAPKARAFPPLPQPASQEAAVGF